MIKYIYIFLVILPFASFAQNNIEWAPDYHLTVADYQAPAPNTGTLLSVSGSFYVSYEMGGFSLITTRNLNKYVSCYFQKDESYIDKADDATTNRLLRYQQLIFNIYELQARNLRKKFFVERTRLLTKGPGILREEAATEHAELLSKVEDETSNGYRSEVITKWLHWTDLELEKLSNFCKTCKPKKQKR